MENLKYSELRHFFAEKGMKEEDCEKLSKRLLEFAALFQRNFIRKISDYNQEATGNSIKLHGKTKMAQFFLKHALGSAAAVGTFKMGFGFAGYQPVKDAAGKINVFEFFDTHKDKAVSVISKIEKFNEENYPKLCTKIAIRIFSIYEQQLLEQFDDVQWLTLKERLAKDAVKRIIGHFDALNIEDAEKNLNLESIIMDSFYTNLQTSKTDEFFSFVVKRSKSLLKRDDKWTFRRFDKKCGIASLTNKGGSKKLKYYWNGKETTPKFGFKLMPFDSQKQEEGYKGTLVEQYDYLLSKFITKKDGLNATVEKICRIIKKNPSGDVKEMHDGIIELNEVAKENNEVIKNVDRKLDDIDKKMDKVLVHNEEDGKQKEKRNEVKSEEILAPVASFIGRENELKAIHEKLNSDEESQGRIAHAVCVCGLGGMGKTELARKYVEVHRQEFEKLYWINADNITYDEQAITDFQENHINSSKGKKILIVLDNAHRFEDVVPFFSKTRMNNVFFLITSRSKNWDAQQEGEIHLVELTTFKEARELIENKLPGERKEDVDELIDVVGSLPLALQQAISFITNKQKKQRALRGKSDYKIQDYVEEFKKNSRTFLDERFDKVRYLQTVYTTWNITFQQIEQDEEHGKKAIEIMRIIAFLDPTFEVSYLTEVNGFDEDAIYLLNRYSLINLTTGWNGRLASVHRLVQEVIRVLIREISPIADCNNLEETILSELIELEDIYEMANEDFWERLQDEKYAHIFKNYCQQFHFEKMPLRYIFLYKKIKIFETMWTKKYLNWQEDNVKKAIRANIQIILVRCNVNIACEILNELENENLIFELPDSTSHFESEKEEMKQQTFKLIALLSNEDEESKEALFEHLSQIEDANLIKEILEMSDYYVRERKFDLYNDLLYLAINKDQPGILSNYLLKHFKQRETRHLKYAIYRKKENAFCELANKEFIEEIYNKNILIKDVYNTALNIFDYVYTWGTLKMVKHLESVGFKNQSNDLTFYLTFYIKCEFEVFEYAFCNDVINARRKDSLGRSALFYAARAKRVDLFEFLIRSSEKCFAIDLENEQDKKGNTLLHYALSLCDMDNGQNDVDKDYIFSGWRFLHAELSLIKVLLKAGADPSKANVYGQTAFMLAAYWNREEAIKCLLPTTDSAAVSLIVNQRCCDGRTALHYAAMLENYEQITLLISKLNTQSSTISPLCIVQQHTEFGKTIEILLEYGADAKQEDNFGRLPLHYASMTFKTLTKCELFGFELKEWPSLKDPQGNTPLHYAAIVRNLFLLLEVESDGELLNLKNVVNKQNQHLLHSLAISKRNIFTLILRHVYYDYKNVLGWLIIKKGLDLSAKDIFGHTPMDIARERNNQDFIKAIEEI